MVTFAWIITTALVVMYSDEECSGALESLTSPLEMSQTDRDIGRLRLLPFYRTVCPDKDWDGVETALLAASSVDAS